MLQQAQGMQSDGGHTHRFIVQAFLKEGSRSSVLSGTFCFDHWAVVCSSVPLILFILFFPLYITALQHFFVTPSYISKRLLLRICLSGNAVVGFSILKLLTLKHSRALRKFCSYSHSERCMASRVYLSLTLS